MLAFVKKLLYTVEITHHELTPSSCSTHKLVSVQMCVNSGVINKQY